MRWVRAAVVLAVLLAACGGEHPASSASASPTPSSARAPTASPPGAPTPTPVSVSMVVGGTPAATRAQLLAGCQRTPDGYGAQFQLTVGGAQSVLSIEIIDYHGPDTYSIPPERVSLYPTAGGAPALEPATSGRVEIGAGERSGSVDVTVQGDHPTRLSGSWSCA